MAQSNFEKCLKLLLAHEGGFTNHPSDPGGPTNFGITLADYRAYVKANASAADIKAMRVEEAAKIFHEEYWSALACDALPGGVDYSVFDYGVNSGCKRAGKVLRRLVGLRDDDWRVSDGVISATAKRDPKMLVAAINEERLTFLKQLSTWPVFGKGWARRVADVRSVSLAMTSERAAGEVVAPPAQNAPGKAHATVSKKVGGAIAAGATAGVGGILAAAKEWVVAHPIAAGVLTLVAIAVGVLVVCAIARWRTQRQEAPTPGFDALPTFH